MADDRHYVAGDFYRICDLTGFKVRANRTRKQWNNYIVRSQSFELRQPQDFVRGVRDDQTVPQPRPRSTDVFIQTGTTLTGSTTYNPALGYATTYPPGTTVMTVNDPTIFTVGNKVAIVQDDGTQVFAKVTNISGSSITFDTKTTFWTTAGNIINDLTYTQLQPSQLPASNGNGVA